MPFVNSSHSLAEKLSKTENERGGCRYTDHCGDVQRPTEEFTVEL